MEIKHRKITANGIELHIAEAGEGPLVLLCHGFPESWYSWRHQLQALASAGYRAVAPDMRGYGQSEQPKDIGEYTILHLAGDMVGILDALERKTAVIVGHDWGAPVAWHSALFRPDRFRGVVGLSVPYRPRAAVRPTSVMPQTDTEIFYQLYFQEPGVAEAAFEKDVRTSILRALWGWSGDARANSIKIGEGAAGMIPRTDPRGFGAGIELPSGLPKWLRETDVEFYAAEFSRTGFKGGLNWYRNIDRNWELLRAWSGAQVTVPALYVVGDRDGVLAFKGMEQLLPALKIFVPQLRDTVVLSGCGHWTQQERPNEVNQALIKFLSELGEF